MKDKITAKNNFYHLIQTKLFQVNSAVLTTLGLNKLIKLTKSSIKTTNLYKISKNITNAHNKNL